MINDDVQIRDRIRQRIEKAAGLVDERRAPLDVLRKTQWSELFESLMRNRLLFGAYRYGDFNAQARQGKRHKNIESLIRRANKYLETGNQELLVDIANLAMVEFIAPGSHPDPHWSPVDDDGEHVIMC